MKKFIAIIIYLMLVFYGAACGYLFVYQRSLLYKPDKQYVAPNTEKLPNVQEITLKTKDKLKLDGWYVPSKNGKIVLYFNGNKSGMQLHENFYAEIVKAGYGLLTFNYRGYGKNEGAPTEQGLYDDAHAAISYLQQKKIPLESVIFLGRSLGSGVAMQMATEYLPHALVLISPYSSIAAIAKMQYPFMPIDLLLLDKFDSFGKAAQISSPTFIFHGENDTLIPPSEGKKLHQAIHGSKLFIYENQDHNNLNFAQIMLDLQAALILQENMSKAH
jgi:uncharacterized protein